MRDLEVKAPTGIHQILRDTQSRKPLKFLNTLPWDEFSWFMHLFSHCTNQIEEKSSRNCSSLNSHQSA